MKGKEYFTLMIEGSEGSSVRIRAKSGLINISPALDLSSNETV